MRRRRDDSIDEAIRREELLIQRYQEELLAIDGSPPCAPVVVVDCRDQESHTPSVRGKTMANECAASSPRHFELDDESSKVVRSFIRDDDCTGNIAILPPETHKKPSSSQEEVVQRNKADDESIDTEDHLWSLLFPPHSLGSADHSVSRHASAFSPSNPREQGQEVPDARVLRLQSHVAGFEIRDVTFVSKTDRAASYRFRIRFVEDDQLSVDLTIEFVNHRDASPAANQHAKPNDSVPAQLANEAVQDQRGSSIRRISSVQARFSRKWIQQVLHRNGFLVNDSLVATTDLANLLSGVVAYLEFDRRRRDFLARHPFVKSIADESSSVALRVPLLKPESHTCSQYASLDQIHNLQWLHLSWGWCWRAGKDRLTMAQPYLEGLDGLSLGLKKLIEVSGSCEEAIVLVLNLPSLPPNAKVTKRRRDPSALSRFHLEGSDDESSDEPAGLSEYELQRLERIRRNEQRLRDLGLLDREDRDPASLSRKRSRLSR